MMIFGCVASETTVQARRNKIFEKKKEIVFWTFILLDWRGSRIHILARYLLLLTCLLVRFSRDSPARVCTRGGIAIVSLGWIVEGEPRFTLQKWKITQLWRKVVLQPPKQGKGSVTNVFMRHTCFFRMSVESREGCTSILGHKDTVS